jgi:hypothetical protein
LAIFVEAVKMPRAEIWEASLRPNSVEEALIYEIWFYGREKKSSATAGLHFEFSEVFWLHILDDRF